MPQSSDIFTVIAKIINDNPYIVIFAFILSLAANIIQFINYYRQRQFEDIYDEAFIQWKRNLKGKYTEEQVLMLKKELSSIKNQISNDIPILAKRTYLNNQLSGIKDDIVKLFMRYKDIKRELGHSPDQKLLPKQVEREIQNYITPSFEGIQRKQNNYFTASLLCLYIISLLMIISLIPSREWIELGNINYDTRSFPLRWIVGISGISIVLIWLWWKIIHASIYKYIITQPFYFGIVAIVLIIISPISLFIIDNAFHSWIIECRYTYNDICPPTVEWIPMIGMFIVCSSPIMLLLAGFISLLFRNIRKKKQENTISKQKNN